MGAEHGDELEDDDRDDVALPSRCAAFRDRAPIPGRPMLSKAARGTYSPPFHSERGARPKSMACDVENPLMQANSENQTLTASAAAFCHGQPSCLPGVTDEPVASVTVPSARQGAVVLNSLNVDTRSGC